MDKSRSSSKQKCKDQSGYACSTVSQLARMRSDNGFTRCYRLVLKHWIQHGFYDFEEDEQLQKELLDFIENTMKKTGMENPANQLIKMYNRQVSHY